MPLTCEGHPDLPSGRPRVSGSFLGLDAEYLRPVAGSSWFVAPRIRLRSQTQRFSVAGDPIASYQTQRARAGEDVGVILGATSELRVGYDIGLLDAHVQVGAPVLRLQGVALGRPFW